MTASQGLFEELPESPPINRSLSPLRIVISLAVLIFLAETLSMIVLYILDLPNYVVLTLLDGLIMILLILPGLYFLQLNPLRNQIKQRTQVEQALRAKEGLLRKVLELLPVGVWITDKSGKIVQGNPTSQRIWATARNVGIKSYDEEKGRWVDTGNWVQPEGWTAARGISRGETTLNEEIEIECFGGDHKIILNSAVPILDEEQTIQGGVVVNQDITLVRQAEKDLIQKNELLEKFFISTHILIAYLDRNFNFIRVNDTFARFADETTDYFAGKNHFELYPNEENQAIFQRVVATGEPYSASEDPFVFPEYPEQETTYWDWSLQPVKGAGNLVEGVVFSVLDATERKRAEIQLEQQNQELRALTDSEHRQREFAESLVQAMITVNTSLELDRVLGSILEQIRKAVPFQGAFIGLLEGKMMRIAGFLGFERHPEGRQVLDELIVLDDFPLLQQVCTSLQPVVINSDTLHPGWHFFPGMEWVCSYAAVPLIVGGQGIGVINLASQLPGEFSPQDVEQLTAFAAPAALALHNARSYQAESSARQVAETLSAAAKSLKQTLELEPAINTLLDHLQEIVHSDTASVTLLEDEARPVQRIARGYGKWAEWDEIPQLPIDGVTDSLIKRIKLARKSLAIPNVNIDPVPGDQSDFNHIRQWLVVPVFASDTLIGLLELGRAGAGIFSPEQVQWAEALVDQAAVAIQNAQLFEQVRSNSERLKTLAHKLVEIQENERSFIARELHDEAGQVLSSLKLSLGRLEQDPECTPMVQTKLQELKSSTDSVLEGLHRLAMNLRPVALDHLGLVAALEQYTKNLAYEELGIQFKALGFDGKRLSPDMETALYRIVQEALTNVVRHAHASNTGILLEWSGGKVKLFIEDDGVGFGPDPDESVGRIGLIGIQERAEMFGGNLLIESSTGRGTSIIVEVPDGDSYSYRG